MAPLSQRALHGLKAYQFKAGGYTWMDHAHNPVWNWLVNRLPLWLAPNLITLTALLSIVTAYMLNAAYNPDFTGEAPKWVYVYTAAAVAAYVNLDNMDGKQARRTGSSSPLGQLFDHGCDALGLHLILGNISASLGVGCGWRMAAGCLGIMVPWLMAQWEEYHTGIMMYGNAAYGVLEANYSICLVHIISAVWGLNLWRTRAPLPAPLAAWWGESAALADLALVTVSVAGLGQGASNVWRVFAPGRAQLTQREVGHKALGTWAATYQLLGLLTCTLTAALEVALTGTTATYATTLTHTDPAPAWLAALGVSSETAVIQRLSFSLFGLSYALTATELIIAHMAKEPWHPSWPSVLIPAVWSAYQLQFVGVYPDVLARVVPPLPAVCVLFAAMLTCYLAYVLGVVRQVCAFLNVRCFTITHQKQL